jgi:antitoxin HigA-1
MHMEIAERPGVDPVLARTLAKAIDGSPKPRRTIARETGLHKDALLGVIRGTRAVTTDEALRLFSAAGVPSKGILALALAGHEELASEWMHQDMGQFWDELFRALPGTLADALGEDLQEIRPRWAVGTSRLVAKLLAEHVRDVISRDLSVR